MNADTVPLKQVQSFGFNRHEHAMVLYGSEGLSYLMCARETAGSGSCAMMENSISFVHEIRINCV